MAITFRYLMAGFALCALTLGAHGQTNPATKPKEVSLQFTVFALGGMAPLGYEPKAKSALAPVKFFSAYRSSEYSYRGETTLCFFDGQAADKSQSPVAIYTIPEGATKLLLLFFPKAGATGDGLKYDVFGVDDAQAKTPAGTFSTINISGHEYAAQYGTTRLTIPKGVGDFHPAKGSVSLLLATQMEGHWMPSGRHVFAIGNQDRVILIFYPPASDTGIYPIIRRLVDTVPVIASKNSLAQSLEAPVALD